MAAVNIYLFFDGQAEEVINFYKSVFGGELVNFQRFKDAPSEHQMSEADGNRIMHATLPVGGGTMILISDIMKGRGTAHIAGNNFSIAVTADSEEEANRIFNGLSEGGKVDMPLGKMFWGAYFGMLVDKFGVAWMVNYDYPKEK